MSDTSEHLRRNGDRTRSLEQLRPNSPIGLYVPFTWDEHLITFCSALNKARDCRFPVRVIYAADRLSLTGTGRGANSLPPRDRPLEDYVAAAHREGIEFHYLWNAPFLDGREWNPQFQEQLRREARHLAAAGVDCIVAANPALQHFVRHWEPSMKIGTSVNNHLDSEERARQLIDGLGVDNIMLDHRNSRNFPLVRALRRAFPDKEIIVLANESCLRDCVLQCFHQASLGSASRQGGCAADPDFHHILCARAKLMDPTHALKAPWLRPEDIHHVFEAGGSLVKLAGRTESTTWIKELVTAYATGHYEGDVFRLIEKSGLRNPAWEDILGRELPACRFKVNNAALDGFIKPFVEGTVPCVQGNAGCGSCQWCARYMHAVTVPGNRDTRIHDVEELLAACVGSGTAAEPMEEALAK